METQKTIALITGANRGLDLEIARQLGNKGFIVLLGARDQAAGDAAAEQLTLQGTTSLRCNFRYHQARQYSACHKDSGKSLWPPRCSGEQRSKVAQCQ